MFCRKRVLGILGALSLLLSNIPPLPVFVPTAMAAAPETILSDGFGTGSDMADIPDWDEEGDDADSSTQAKNATGGGSPDSASPDGGRFAKIGRNEWICRTVDASSLESLMLQYYWRGDGDTESDDDGIVEYKTGGDCADGSGWTQLQNHDLTNYASWTAQSAFSLPESLDDSSFLLRFRTVSSADDEFFRVDGVLVTGEPIPGTLRVIKSAVGGDGTFDFTGAASFQIATSDGSGAHDITDLEAGTYSVDETPPPGWQLASNACQDVSVTAGDTAECTITNTKAATVTIVKETEGGDEEFSFGGLEEGMTEIATVDGTGEETVSVFPAAEGTEYTVTESIPEGWDLTNISCEGADVDIELPAARFTLEPGDDVTCTFHNIKKGTLRITKQLVNYGGAEGDALEFPIEIDGGGSYAVVVGAGENNGSLEIPLAPGEYAVTESALPEGWQLVENGCEEIEIAAGETTECTITNKKESRIVIHKTAIGTLGTFHYIGLNGEAGLNVAANEQEEGGSNRFLGESFFDVFVDVGGEEFTISEELAEASLWEQTGDESSCSFLLQPGQTEHCYFENTKKATIIVRKETTGGDGTFTVSSNSEEIGSFDLTTVNGTAERSFPVLVDEETTFTFQEVNLPDEWEGSPDHCEVTVGPGDTNFCDLGNIKKARLIIEKDTIGGDGTFRFVADGFSPDGRNCEEGEEDEFCLATNEETRHAETFFDIFVDIGSSQEVTVTEQSADGWQVVGSSSCTVSLEPGEVQTCSFVNAKAAHLTVEKTTTGGTGTFHFTGIGDEGGFDLTTLVSGEPVSSFFDVFVDIGEGTTYTVTETLQEGWGTTPESCTVTLHPGEEKTCSFENSALSPLTLLAGRDIFETPAGTTTFPLPALPEDFFGPGCSPFSGEVHLGGVPTDPTSLGNTDTTVRRLSDASLPAPGSSATVPIELVALSLQSVEPLQVHCGGEEPSTSFWNVIVSLPESSQPQGQMTVQRTSPEGGTFTSELPIRPLFTFRHTTDGTTRTYDTAGDGDPFLTLATEGRPWLSEPCPSDMLRVPGTTTNFCPSAESDGRVPTTATDNGAQHRYLPTGVAEEESGSSSSSSSSSEGSSSSAPLPGDNDGESGGAGSGHGSRSAFAKARFLANFHGIGELPPGAFGAGPEVPLGPEELTFICSMQRALPPIPPPGLLEVVGAHMAAFMGRDPAFIIEQLQDPFLCESIHAALRLVPQTVVKATIPFPVGMDGLPLSRNPSWNACIRGQVTLDVIRNNPDRDEDGKPRDCASYSTENIWRHPDLGVYFVFRRSPLKIELPQGYVLWKLKKNGPG